MRWTSVLSGASLAFLAACSSLSGAPPPAQTAARPDQPFTLKPGASVVVADRLRVAFDRVLSESRCPKDVQCIQAGQAVIRAFVTTPSQPREAVELSTRGENSSAEIGQWTLTLTVLDPVPLAAKPTRATDYRATFTLTRH